MAEQNKKENISRKEGCTNTDEWELAAVKKRIEEAELHSSEAVSILKDITENVVFIGGTDYRINEKYVQSAFLFLHRITD